MDHTKKYIILLILISNSFVVLAQLSSPLELIASPFKNRYAISGLGGGNFSEFNLDGLSFSAQVAIDFNAINILKTTKKGNDKVISHGILLKINPGLTSRVFMRDSISPTRLISPENEHVLAIGYRIRNLLEIDMGNALGDNGNADIFYAPYIDFMYTPYNVNIDTSTARFHTINISLGFQFGVLFGGFKIGNIGLDLSGFASYLNILNDRDTPYGFENAMNIQYHNVPKNFIGTGGKLLVQFNDFTFFFEAKYFWAVDSSLTVIGLNDSVNFSIGGLANGILIKGGSDEVHEKW
ncbi:MAG: hypothetical protein AB8E82_05185 [Aureispira sp.]